MPELKPQHLIEKIYAEDPVWESHADRLFGWEHSRTFGQYGLFTKERHMTAIDFASASIGVSVNCDVPSPSVLIPSEGPFIANTFMQHAAESARESIAALMGVNSRTIHFTYNTTDAFRKALEQCSLKKGQNIVTTTDEYGSIRHELQDLEKHGITLRRVPVTSRVLDDVLNAFDKKTALLVTSHITHETCEILPYTVFGAIAHANGIRYIVDAAQSLGQMPVRPSPEIDMLVSCGHKWLRGRPATGILYVSESLGEPNYFPTHAFSMPRGSKNIPDYHRNFNQVLDSGYGGVESLMHLNIALSEHERIGWAQEFKRIAELGSYAREQLSNNPYLEVYRSVRPAPGMVLFNVPGLSPEQVCHALETRYRIIATDKRSGVRAAFSPFNTTLEIDILNTALEDIAQDKDNVKIEHAAYSSRRTAYSDCIITT